MVSNLGIKNLRGIGGLWLNDLGDFYLSIIGGPAGCRVLKIPF
jgi:hypothetical protein